MKKHADAKVIVTNDSEGVIQLFERRNGVLKYTGNTSYASRAEHEDALRILAGGVRRGRPTACPLMREMEEPRCPRMVSSVPCEESNEIDSPFRVCVSPEDVDKALYEETLDRNGSKTSFPDLASVYGGRVKDYYENGWSMVLDYQVQCQVSLHKILKKYPYTVKFRQAGEYTARGLKEIYFTIRWTDQKDFRSSLVRVQYYPDGVKFHFVNIGGRHSNASLEMPRGTVDLFINNLDKQGYNSFITDALTKMRHEPCAFLDLYSVLTKENL